jgi:hypothetical protein
LVLTIKIFHHFVLLLIKQKGLITMPHLTHEEMVIKTQEVQAVVRQLEWRHTTGST